jgi:hypothetical protein
MGIFAIPWFTRLPILGRIAADDRLQGVGSRRPSSHSYGGDLLGWRRWFGNLERMAGVDPALVKNSPMLQFRGSRHGVVAQRMHIAEIVELEQTRR